MNDPLEQQDTELFRRQAAVRERVLARLWEIANLSPEATRNSASAQVKALSLIIAIEALIPDRRSPASEKKSRFPPVTGTFYKAKWLREQEERNANPSNAPDSIGESEPIPPPAPAFHAPARRPSTQNPDPVLPVSPTSRETEPTLPPSGTRFPFVWGK